MDSCTTSGARLPHGGDDPCVILTFRDELVLKLNIGVGRLKSGRHPIVGFDRRIGDIPPVPESSAWPRRLSDHSRQRA